MNKPKSNYLHIILCANALILVIGTIMVQSESPYRDLVMSMLFFAWIGLFAWRIVSSRAETSLS